MAIDVENVNEHAPVVTSLPATFTVSEYSKPPTLIGLMKATDADADSTITFYIKSGNVGDKFSIDATTGRF